MILSVDDRAIYTWYYVVLARFLSKANSVPKIKHKKVKKTLDKSLHIHYLRYSWSMVANEPRESNMDNDEQFAYERYLREKDARSTWRECQGCGEPVKLPPEHGYCDTCADARERGIDL